MFFFESLLNPLLHPFLRIFGMTLPTKGTEEFPHDCSIEAWEYSVIRLVTSTDAKQGTEARYRMGRFKISELRRYKETSFMEHEYLIAEIAPNSSYLRIERYVRETDANGNIDPEQGEVPLQKDSHFLVQSSPLISSLQKSSAWSGVPADDMVSTPSLSKWPSDDKMIERMRFGGSSSPTLLDLVLAAKVVHDHSSEYRLFDRQCYWYADMVIRTIESVFPQARLDESPKQDEDEEAKVYDAIAGKWQYIQIYQTKQKWVAQTKDSFEEKRECVHELVFQVIASTWT